MNDHPVFSSDALSQARQAFVMAAVPHVGLSLLLLVSMAVMPSGNGNAWNFILFGGIYIFGSLGVLREDIPLSILIWLGLLLNMVGAFVWVPTMLKPDGGFAGFIGVFLTWMWVRGIAAAFRDERH